MSKVYTVLQEFRSEGNFSKVHEIGEDVSEISASQLSRMVDLGMVSVEDSSDGAKPATAAEVIEKISACESVEEIDAIMVDETRVTVIKAAEAKKKELLDI